jgi:DNA-binding PadR family transcriptional regulator
MVDSIILGLLSFKPQTGYEMKSFMRMSTARFYNASFGSIYPALRRLEKKGFVESNGSVRSGKFTKNYRILEKGREEFIKWLEEPISSTNMNFGFLIKIFFFRHLLPGKAVPLLKNFISNLEQGRKEVEKLESAVGKNLEYFELSILHFGLDYYRLLDGWCKKLVAGIKKRERKVNG